MRDRTPPDLRRKRHIREPKRRFYLFCEGTRTEPQYFMALQNYLNSVQIAVVPEQAAGVPFTLAQKAVDRAKSLGIGSRKKPANSFEQKDEVWVVFDRDEHPHFEDAIKCCERGGVGVARSNPCFEVWLILHEQDYDKPDNRHEVQAHLCNLRPEYHAKNKVPDCADLVTHVEIAEERALKQLDRRLTEGAAYGPPSTTVGQLTKAIRSAAEMSKPR